MKTNNTEPKIEDLQLNHFEQVWLEHNTCCLCGSELHFQHETNYLLMQVQEQAHCPSCQVRTASRTFTLQ